MAKTRSEWIDYIKALILAVDRNLDVDFGAINGVFVQPESIILSNLDAEITRLDQIIDINNYALMTDDEFAALLNNYLMQLLPGNAASGVVYFQAIDITSDITIPAGFPVSTDLASYGSAVVFATTQQAQMLAAQKSLYFNTIENIYEIPVNVIAVVPGETGQVAAGAVRVMQRSIPGITSVINKTSFTTGGVGAETRDRAIRRLKGFLKSAGALSLKFGLTDNLLTYVQDVVVLGARDAGFERTSHESGAVDAYSSEQTYRQAVDYFRIGYYNLENYGSQEVWIFENQPVISDAPFTVTINGVDHTDWFYIEKDINTAYSGSTRGRDVLKVLPAYVLDLNNAFGQYGVVTYNYNVGIANLQSIFSSDDKYVFGRDLMIREALKEKVRVVANLKALPGYNSAYLANVVQNAILSYINTLGISEPLEEADLTFIAKSYAGVDNFTYTDLRLLTEPAGTVHDLCPASRGYFRADNRDVVVTGS